jgi:hypothetical protein
MIVANISTAEMADVLEAGANGTDFQNGKTDAVGHVGMMLTGVKTAEEISDLQNTMLANVEGDYDSDYIRGYSVMWAELHAMLF